RWEDIPFTVSVGSLGLVLRDSRDRHPLVRAHAGRDVSIEMPGAAGSDRAGTLCPQYFELHTILHARRGRFWREFVAAVLRVRWFRVDRTNGGRSERQHASLTENSVERHHYYRAVLRLHVDRFVWRSARRALGGEQRADG